jgi:uncharacterized membrane protein
MSKGRMEAFTDGVIAILITIMVFDLKAPGGSDAAALGSVVPAALTYLLSFLYLGIYWNNHHHLWQLASRVSGGILWANLHLLFWLSLVPFATSWMRASEFAPVPVAVYGGVLLLSAMAWWLLQTAMIVHQGKESPLREAVGADWKAKGSALLYVTAIGLAFVIPWASVALYVVVALVWVIPDTRFEGKATRTSDLDGTGR